MTLFKQVWWLKKYSFLTLAYWCQRSEFLIGKKFKKLIVEHNLWLIQR